MSFNFTDEQNITGLSQFNPITNQTEYLLQTDLTLITEILLIIMCAQLIQTFFLYLRLRRL